MAARSYTEAPNETIGVGGISYAYRRLGEPSKAPLVCFQHFTGTLDNWDPQVIDALAAKREVITIDNAGIGNSGGETPDNVRAMADISLRIIKALGIGQCDVLGFSLGGFITQTIAVTDPELFRKIILVGTAPQGAEALRSFPALTSHAFKLPGAEGYLYLFATPSEPSRAKLKASLARQTARKEDRDKQTTMAAIQQQTKALTRWGIDPVTLDLSTISQPVLIIQGSNDTMMGSAASFDLFQKLPNAFLNYYPDASHGSFFQYPEVFAGQANDFLDNQYS
jgi:pimeloyl-ACP methyl ester carboxylesterase